MQPRSMRLPETGPDTRLRDEHAGLDARFDDLCLRAREGDWSDVDEVWDDFADDLEAHLAYEEREVFPRLATEAPALVERLLAQHRMIRDRLAELGVEIQVHVVRAESLEAFVAALREHAALENEKPLSLARRAPTDEMTDADAWWALDARSLLDRVESGADGLTSAVAAERLQTFGRNADQDASTSTTSCTA